jgi:cell division protein ZipA
MDPDLVRLILVVLGVALVAAIYLWDRYKHAPPRPVRRRRAHREPVVRQEPAGDEERLEPATGEAAAVTDSRPIREPEPELKPKPEPEPESESEPEPEPGRATWSGSGDKRAKGSPLDPEPVDLGQWSDAVAAAEPQFALDLSFDAHGDADYLASDPALRDEVEHLIIAIHIAARDGVMAGPAIAKACVSVGLVPGDMSIFHRRDPAAGDRVLFSLASMVEPGSFPVDEMAGFATPGLTLFTQLPGPRDGLAVYDAMLATAERLAELLRGELLDERHNKLTRQMQEHTRVQIQEHRHRVRLARSRR